MSDEHNEIIKEHIESKVVEANFSAEDLLAELGMKYQDAYEEKLSYDQIVNLVIEKRFEEFSEVE